MRRKSRHQDSARRGKPRIFDQIAASIAPSPDGKPIIAASIQLNKVRNALLPVPLSRNSWRHPFHLPLGIDNIALDLAGGLSPKTKAAATGAYATIALSGGEALALV
ncbi:MAG: hypothetical protein R3D05_22850 [Dongiaceae bacterium]